ncbi:hypothetical protein ACFX2J_043579 [Malus domestica]|uniref:Uncharacterized protein n=1 Tax=Malus domestica TaxID=3750 RepID=A0A498JBD7_MALDO|nr:hypothetical protein DVH24_021178 [Malus domestica]
MSMLLDTPSELDITSKFGSSENINFSNCKILTSNYHWESFTYWAIDFALILQRHGQYDALEEHRGLHGVLKERKVTAAVRCFFRASSGKGSSQALLSLPQEVGLPNLGFTGIGSAYAWRLHYYQWAMQTFEQYNICKGACEFAAAALERVEEAFNVQDEHHV